MDNEEKIKELCLKFREGEIHVNPFIQRLEKLGIPDWMGRLVVAGIQPVRGDYEQAKTLCKKFSNKEIRVSEFTDALEKQGMPCWVGFVIHDLQREVCLQTNIGKLSPEDQAIAMRWERERKERTALYDQLDTVSKKKDPEAWDELMDKIRDNEPSHCEHGRSWASTCYSCEKIHQTLFGEIAEKEDEEQ